MFRHILIILISYLFGAPSFASRINRNAYFKIVAADYSSLSNALRVISQVNETQLASSFNANQSEVFIQISTPEYPYHDTVLIDRLNNLVGPNVSIRSVDLEDLKLGTQDDMAGL